MHYCGMMFVKVVCFLFFLFPYIACRLCGKGWISRTLQIRGSRREYNFLEMDEPSGLPLLKM